MILDSKYPKDAEHLERLMIFVDGERVDGVTGIEHPHRFDDSFTSLTLRAYTKSGKLLKSDGKFHVVSIVLPSDRVQIAELVEEYREELSSVARKIPVFTEDMFVVREGYSFATRVCLKIGAFLYRKCLKELMVGDKL